MGPETVDRDAFASWRTEVLAFLVGYGQRGSVFQAQFTQLGDEPVLQNVIEGLAILRNFRDHLRTPPPRGASGSEPTPESVEGAFLRMIGGLPRAK